MTELLKQMRTPSLSADDVFKNTRFNVSDASHKEQVPSVFSSLTQSFSFSTAAPVISANGTSNGILWILDNSSFLSTCCQVLYAYDATNLAKELYNSNQASGLGTLVTAGYTAINMPGLSDRDFPLYIDTRCHLLSATRYRSQYETDCSMQAGGSGQPLFSGLIRDPRNPNVFLTEHSRPILTVVAMHHAGGGNNPTTPNFHARSFAVLFDESMRRQVQCREQNPAPDARSA